MKVLSLPFTKKLGIQKSEIEGYILQQKYNVDNLNHIGTVHASASYALAEITSGQFLQYHFNEFSESTIPILRRSSIKYSQGISEDLFSKAKFIATTKTKIKEELKVRKKTQFSIEVKLYNRVNQLIASCLFDWFVKLK